MNIILVVFDSLRKDCVGVYGAPPWGKVITPHFDAFAKEALVLTNVYPESLPTLPVRRALYTGQRVYPFEKGDFRLKGDFVGAPGWGPIPEEQPTLAEMLRAAGYRTGLIADVYHMFKPSKNYWRGFDQWTFLRGQEKDPQRSGPRLTQEQIDHWLPKSMQNESAINFIQQCIMNMHGREKEEDYFAPRVFKEAALWLEQNQDADNFFLTVESFDPHEPWLIPPHYRKMYGGEKGPEQVKSSYADVAGLPEEILRRTRTNYSGEVTMCDRWFGYFMETMRVLGLLNNTMIIFTADHGHSIGDGNYMGKRGYPSSPEVLEVPLMIRFPQAKHADKTSAMFLQHTDITAAILDAAGAKINHDIEGRPFIKKALANEKGHRDHVTIGWGSAVTVITEKWWLNCKVDGTGVFLYELKSERPFGKNAARNNPNVVNELFARAKEDAGGKFPEWLVNLARKNADAPGCSDLAARV